MVFNDTKDFGKYMDMLNAFDERPEVIQVLIGFADGTKGAICIDYNLSVLSSILDKSKDTELNGFINIIDSDGNIVLGSKANYTTESFIKILPYYAGVAEQLKTSAGAPIKVTDDKGNDWISFSNKTSDFDWYVLYRIPGETFFATQVANMIKSLIVGAVLTIIAILLSMFTVNQSLHKLVKFQQTMIDASSNNDLTIRIPVETDDELGKIAESMNQFISKVQEIVVAVRNATIEVASSNNELAATMEELSTTFDSQAEQVENMVNSMGQVGGVFKSTSMALSENMQSLESTATMSKEETQKLEVVAKDMEEIETDTVTLSNSIDSLYTHMQPVAKSVDEQQATVQTVVDNAQVIAAGIEESNAAVSEVNKTVSHLQQRTEGLKQLIEQFKA